MGRAFSEATGVCASRWTLTAEQVQELRALCVGIYCQQMADQLVNVWRQPLPVAASHSSGQTAGMIAHYSAISEEDFFARLKQLPTGTRIRIIVEGPDAETLGQAIAREVASISPRPRIGRDASHEGNRGGVQRLARHKCSHAP
jgi:hypothetical protein